MDDRPVALGDVVGGELRVAGHAPPGEEHAQGWRPRSAVMRIRSRTKQIWASRTSGTGLLKSLLAATA